MCNKMLNRATNYTTILVCRQNFKKSKKNKSYSANDYILKIRHNM